MADANRAMRLLMTRPAQHRRVAPTVRPIDPRPGLFLTCVICYPYLSDSMQTVPRSTAHDVALAAVLTLVWGTVFFWEMLARKLPAVRSAIEIMLGLTIIGGTAALYGTAIYFIVMK